MAELLRGVVCLLDAGPDERLPVHVENGEQLGRIGTHPPFEPSPTTERDLFVLASESLAIVFRRTADGRVTGVSLRRAGNTGNDYSRRPDD